MHRWKLWLMAVLVIPAALRASPVNIVTTNPANELPTGFLQTAESLSNEWAKVRRLRNGNVITTQLKTLRVMAATHPNDPDVKCWLGVANLLMAQRLDKSRFKYTKAATDALSAAKGLHTDNICFQCVLINKMREAGNMSLRGQLSATDEQCTMLPQAPAN